MIKCFKWFCIYSAFFFSVLGQSAGNVLGQSTDYEKDGIIYGERKEHRGSVISDGQCSCIVIMSVESSSQDALRKLKEEGTSVHYMIDNLGKINELVEPKYRAYATGFSNFCFLDRKTENSRSMNNYSASIMLTDLGKGKGTLEQLNALSAVIEGLSKTYNIDTKWNLFLHSDFCRLRWEDLKLFNFYLKELAERGISYVPKQVVKYAEWEVPGSFNDEVGMKITGNVLHALGWYTRIEQQVAAGWPGDRQYSLKDVIAAFKIHYCIADVNSDITWELLFALQDVAKERIKDLRATVAAAVDKKEYVEERLKELVIEEEELSQFILNQEEFV